MLDNNSMQPNKEKMRHTGHLAGQHGLRGGYVRSSIAYNTKHNTVAAEPYSLHVHNGHEFTTKHRAATRKHTESTQIYYICCNNRFRIP